MSLPLKPDAAQLSEEVDLLAAADWIDKSRNWWPYFLFHYTSIENAVKILEQGFIYSRKHMEDDGCNFHDGASPEIIHQTKNEWKEYVRLFFRPRTPTIYSNEGFRPRVNWQYEAHCPVPVCFLFDAKKVLSMVGVSFSDGSLASSKANIFSTATEYHNLPFDKIFHDSYFSQDDKSAILYHRQAEVIVKDELDLVVLKKVFCRSEAEYRALQFLIDKSRTCKYKNLIGSSQKGNLFFKNWLFVERVDLETGKLHITCSKKPGEFEGFKIRVIIKDVERQITYRLNIDNGQADSETFYIKIPEDLNSDNLIVSIYFDDCLMFTDRFESNAIPF